MYDHALLCDVFASAGFELDLLEYCDARGRFHCNDWDYASAPIYCSFRSDHRNRNHKLGFVSLILDATKPPR